jgi:dCMP deaminase
VKKFDKAMLKTAQVWAQMSYCNRLQVGAVIAKEGRILSVGYNGTPSGTDNNCEEDNKTLPNVIHAEMNAILFAAKEGISTKGCSLYVTHAPCENCSKHIIQAGIIEVVYINEYRDMGGINTLKKQNIKVRKINLGDEKNEARDVRKK